MAIWGSIIGGMLGFSIGGPFGMLLGSLIGGKMSRARSSGGFRSFAQPQQIFALSLIVLSAKLSKADGQVSREELIAKSDLIVEAAGGDVVPELARETFESGKDLMAISIGALIDYPDIIELAKRLGCKLYAPSGAIAGLDGIKSASIGKIDKVTMITRKPLIALEGSPYLVEKGISVLGFTEE